MVNKGVITQTKYMESKAQIVNGFPYSLKP